jgi:hypothetical protein
MANYRCYFLGCDDSFMAVESFNYETDDAAIAQGIMLGSHRPQFAGFELWQGGRFIGKRVAKIFQQRPR